MDWQRDEAVEFRLEDSLLLSSGNELKSLCAFAKQLTQHFEMIPMKICMMHIERSLETGLMYSFSA